MRAGERRACDVCGEDLLWVVPAGGHADGRRPERAAFYDRLGWWEETERPHSGPHRCPAGAVAAERTARAAALLAEAVAAWDGTPGERWRPGDYRPALPVRFGKARPPEGKPRPAKRGGGGPGAVEV